MIAKHEYIEYLLKTPFNYTCTNMADHKPNLSHDVVSDFLAQQRFAPADLWAILKAQVDDVETACIIVDDGVQAKRHYGKWKTSGWITGRACYRCRSNHNQ